MEKKQLDGSNKKHPPSRYEKGSFARVRRLAHFNYYPDIEFINHLIRIGGLDETENSEKTEIPFLFLSVSRYNKQIINENDSRELQFLFLRVSPAPPIIRYNLEWRHYEDTITNYTMISIPIFRWIDEMNVHSFRGHKLISRVVFQFCVTMKI